MPNDTESLSPVLPLPVIQDDLYSVAGNDVILDSGKLSHVNFVYNDITLQVFPTFKIPNNRSNRTDTPPMDDEPDISGLLQD
ncbi:MAG: hypothetical protein WBX01_14545 [Nitrososphaeraceae archaeon]